MRRIGLAAVLAMALLATACGDDDDDDASSDDSEETTTTESDSDGGGSADRQAYVDAIVAASGDDEALDEEGNLCLAEAYVDVIGVERLQDKVTPEQIEEEPGSSPADLGIELTEADGEAFYEALGECTDQREYFIASFSQGEAEGVAECLDAGISDDMLKGFAIVAFSQPSETAQTAPEFQAISAVYETCAAEAAGGTTQP